MRSFTEEVLEISSASTDLVAMIGNEEMQKKMGSDSYEKRFDEAQAKFSSVAGPASVMKLCNVLLKRSLAFADVEEERIAQDKEWGGAAGNDNNDCYDWVAFLTKHLGKAVLYKSRNASNHTTERERVFRYQMVRVAALAVAAIEWADRQKREGD